ncbi:MAG TPA: hypothetical protein VG934_01110 [Candidatus Paceibacterota bacterium]|nr:hypothetical protein [Candidatus Paceibacterota bacterium]
MRIEVLRLRALPEMAPQQTDGVPIDRLKAVVQEWSEHNPELHPIRVTLKLPGSREIEAELAYRGGAILIDLPPEAHQFNSGDSRS